jgi:Family of unknown function (DUF6134)
MVLPRAAACALVLLAATAERAAAAADGLPDPMTLYGDDMAFAVWRSGSQIGEHRVTFAREDGALFVRSLFDIAVKFLGVTVYRFRYTAEETWRGGKLQALVTTIDDDGTKTAVNAKEDDGKLDVAGPATHEEIAGFILPSTHWNAQVIEASRVLNTLDGKVDEVRLVPVGVESVPVGTATREATHYRYTGAVTAESWYDAEGHWLKLRFPGKDGTPIDYVCERCVAVGR